MGAFLDEGDDMSLEEMKNRQNAALTSFTSCAASGLKGATGGREFHILPIAMLHHRGADLIETAAEQELLCCCDDGLLSSGVSCTNGLCSSSSSSSSSSSRDRTHNGDKVAPRTSPSSLLSPISNLMVEFERMSLQEEHRNSSISTSIFSSPSPSASDLSPGLTRLSLGHIGQQGGDTAEGGEGEEERRRRSSGSSEEFFEAQESVEGLGRTRGGALGGGRNLCARSKSWDHGGRDLSSSGSSGSSYKSLDNSNEFLPRTPPKIRRGLFIEG